MAQETFPFSQPTKKDMAIQQNRGRMGVIFLRKNIECRGLGSGSIVNVEGSELLYKCAKIKWCLLTSDIDFPVGGIGAGDCFFEYWNSDLKTVQKLSLRNVAQSNVFYRPTPGLALIPVCPSKFEELLTSVGPKSSVLDKRRTFSTRYYYEEVQSESRKLCFIMGSKEGSLTTERFTLITKGDDQGKLQHELRDDYGQTFQGYNQFNDVWSHLYPYGAAILEDEGPQATCVGILNFTKEDDDRLISPIFFTPETLTGKVQLYRPTDGKVKEEAESEHLDGMMEPTTSQIDSAIHSQDSPSSTTASSQAPGLLGLGYVEPVEAWEPVEPGNSGEASLTNEDETVCPDDYTLQRWQKLYEEVRDENTKLKQQSELYDKVRDENTKLKQQSEQEGEVISVLKKGITELRRDITKTEQQNEELLAENERFLSINKELYKALDAKSKELREYQSEWCTENNLLKANNEKLREDNRKLRAENNKLRKEWNEEGDYFREENEALRILNNQLKAKNKELLAKNEELSASLKTVLDQLKELLNQQNRAVFGDDASSIKDSNDEKVEGPSGTSANSSRGDSNGSHKEVEPFLDPFSEDASELK